MRSEGEEEEEDAPKRRGFRDGADLRLGAIKQLTKERERETRRKALNNLVSNDRNKKMVRMHEKCMNM